MNTRSIFATTVAAAALLIAGCTGGPGASPTSAPEPSTPAPTASDSPMVEPPAHDYEPTAVWLDDGRHFAIVTYGGSSCVPTVGEVTGDGQNVTVTFAEFGPGSGCTMDLAPRATIVASPEGVNPSEDVQITFIDPIAPDVRQHVELDGEDDLRVPTGDRDDYAPSAAWVDDHALVVLTWGSSSCLPRVESIDEGKDAASITFFTHDGPCTEDLVARGTIVYLGNEHDDDDFVLTLNGDGLDGVTVRPVDD